MAYKIGDILIAPFLQTDLVEGKNRPALLLAALPNYPGDWLACMITSQLRHFTESIDVILGASSPGFDTSGLKVTSVVRVSRLMVISEARMTGSIGEVPRSIHSLAVSNLIGWLASQAVKN